MGDPSTTSRVVRLAPPRFPIGYRFTRGRGRNHDRIEVVVDYRVTVDYQGDVVSHSYVTEYNVGGTLTRDYDVPEATIARGNAEANE